MAVEQFEMVKQRARDLFFNFDEPFSLDNKCNWLFMSDGVDEEDLKKALKYSLMSIKGIP